MGQRVEANAAIIDRPVEDVWEFMLDISNMPRWEDSRAEWRQTSEGPITIGTSFQSSIRFLGRQFVANVRITDFELSRRFTVEALDTFGRGTKITYLMDAVEGGKTRLSRVTEVELHGLAKLLRPIQAAIVSRTGELEVNNVKRLLEAHAQRRSN